MSLPVIVQPEAPKRATQSDCNLNSRTCLSNKDRRRNGNPKFDDKHEQALVRKLMRAIEDYSKREDIDTTSIPSLLRTIPLRHTSPTLCLLRSLQ
jgi:hypothetical protein